MKNKYKQIEINEIPAGNFEGYYWLSDKSKPELIFNKEIDKTKFSQLPFVVEANFYSEKMEKSIQIKNIDGEYKCAIIDLSDCEYEAQKYIGHDLEYNKNHFDYFVVEAWEEKADELLEGMKTKVPSWVAFKGFVESKTKKND